MCIKSHKHITSEVEQMANELMRATRFRTTHKGDLQHYSHIFGKPETLGTEKKYVMRSRLVKMLHLYTLEILIKDCPEGHISR